MGKFIIEEFTNFFEISGNSQVDIYLFALIGIISLNIAFGSVGRIFDKIGFYDSDLMSGTHWLIRITVFALISWVCKKIIQFFTWVFSFEWWVYLIAFVSLTMLIMVIYIIKYKISKKYSSNYIRTNEINTPIDKSTDNTTLPSSEKKRNYIIHDMCPKCGALLVKRYGPYGSFLGCDMYPRTGCKYTRSI